MTGLVCPRCRNQFASTTMIWRCPCGSLLDVSHAAMFPIEAIVQRPMTMWRYREALPLNNTALIVSLGEPMTPIIEVQLRNGLVRIKQEQLMPTGSFKDRGSAVMISHLRAIGITSVVEDSSGNAGASIAAYCANAGIECHIFVPEATSPSKLKQIQCMGARLVKIPGNRMDTAEAAWKMAERIYYASHYANPFFIHGIKTLAFEIWEQSGWDVPDAIVLPVGNGSLLLGVAQGFSDLLNAGSISRLPRLIAVQAAQCSPIYHAWNQLTDRSQIEHSRKTIAEGIAISQPLCQEKIIQVLRIFQGDCISVSDEEITDALRFCHRAGFYIEPTAAVSIAGITKLGNLDPYGRVVTVFSGHGLKSVESSNYSP